MEEKKKVNTGPLGLIGFGMTTILLNLHNAGIISELSVVIAAMGLCLGGAAQIIAGVLEFKQGNNFGGTAFVAFGFFWWSLVLIWKNPLGVTDRTPTAMGFYLLVWCIFTAVMFVGTLKHNTITKIVFGSLVILFLLLAIGDFAESSMITKIAGFVGIFCGLSAMYSAAAGIINGEFGRTILPV